MNDAPFDDRLAQAEVRLARASAAWLDAEETTRAVRAEYASAFDEVMTLRRLPLRFNREVLDECPASGSGVSS